MDQESFNLITRFFSYSDLSKSSKKTYFQSYKSLLNFIKKNILEITSDDIAKFREDKVLRDLRRTTINKDLHRISSLFVWLVDQKLIEDNPINNITMFKLKKSDKINIRYVTHEVAKQLIEYPLRPLIIKANFQQIRDHTVIAVLYYAGMRTSEISNLKWIHVDLKMKTLYIKESKGNLSRTINILDSLVKILQLYIDNLKSRDRDYVFYSRNSDYLSPDAVRNIVEKYCKLSGIEAIGDKKKVTPVVLRHSYATYLTQKGISPITLSELMGNPTAIERYAHVTDEAKKNAANVFDDWS